MDATQEEFKNQIIETREQISDSYAKLLSGF